MNLIITTDLHRDSEKYFFETKLAGVTIWVDEETPLSYEVLCFMFILLLGLVLIWGSLCVILLAACGMFVTMTSRYGPFV